MAKREFDHCDLIIVGAWNKSIINPIWLCDQFPAIIKNYEFISELKFGSTYVFRHTVNDVSIELGNEKLVFISENDDQGKLRFLSEISSAIIGKLPHTPTMAVGHNFIYKFEKDEIIINNLFDNINHKDLLKILNLENPLEQHVKFTYANQENFLNLGFQKKEEDKIISFNYHYPVDSHKKTKIAISKFIDSYNDSKTIISKLLEGK